MKKSISMLLALTLIVSACKENTSNKSTETKQVESPPPLLPPTTEPNKITKEQLMGSWRSTIDKKSSIEFSSAADNTLKYVMHYDGSHGEQGNWEVPADCKACNPAAPDGCFFFKAQGSEDCCSIVKVTADSLQYIVLGSTGKIQSFVKVK